MTETTNKLGTMNEVERNATVSHNTVRLEIAVGENYDDFRRRFESSVPIWNRDRGVELIERKAPWQDVIATVVAEAPHDFLLYWKLDLAPLMSLAGNTRRATEYLMGNHVIAESMYRHNPAVALYVPLRCAIYESEQGTRFSIEQPSTNLSSLGCKEINSIAIDLDHKLARLLAVLNVEPPAVLTESQVLA
ncbi:MAG: DUF302 domain-containing protein [Candidatus Sulfotelmatobacter sp.]